MVSFRRGAPLDPEAAAIHSLAAALAGVSAELARLESIDFDRARNQYHVRLSLHVAVNKTALEVEPYDRGRDGRPGFDPEIRYGDERWAEKIIPRELATVEWDLEYRGDREPPARVPRAVARRLQPWLPPSPPPDLEEDDEFEVFGSAAVAKSKRK